MAKLAWNNVGDHKFVTGVSKGVLFPMTGTTYTKGVAWGGLTQLTKSPGGAEANDYYADNVKYVTIRSAETLSFTIGAYTFPDEWYECDGSTEVATGVYINQQARKAFGFAYRTEIGNDTEGISHGYKIVLIYNATASPSEQASNTINESPEPSEFSWECSTTPVSVTVDGKTTSTCSIEIDSTKVDKTKLAKLEELLYGTDDAESTLPTPDEVVALFAA